MYAKIPSNTPIKQEITQLTILPLILFVHGLFDDAGLVLHDAGHPHKVPRVSLLFNFLLQHRLCNNYDNVHKCY